MLRRGRVARPEIRNHEDDDTSVDDEVVNASVDARGVTGV